MIASGVVPVLAYLLLVLFLTASWCTRGEGARALTSLKTAKSPARTGRSAALRPGADLDVAQNDITRKKEPGLSRRVSSAPYSGSKLPKYLRTTKLRNNYINDKVAGFRNSCAQLNY